MINKYLIKNFVDEIYSKHPKKNYETNKIIYNHIDEIWSIALADMIDYKNSNNKRFSYIFVILDIYSNFLWAKPIKNKNSETITDEVSNVLSKSKRRPLKLESDRGSEWCNNIFQNILKVKNTHHYSQFTDKGPSIAERVIKTIMNLIESQYLRDWLREMLIG